MANEQIRTQIRSRLAMGESRANIEHGLAVQGWSPAEIDEAFVAAPTSEVNPVLQPEIATAEVPVNKTPLSRSKKIAIGFAGAIAIFSVAGAAYAAWNRTSSFDSQVAQVLCPADLTAEDESDNQKLASIEKEVGRYNASDPSHSITASSSDAELDAQMAQLAKRGEKADALQSQYSAVVTGMLKRQVAAVPQDRIRSLYQTYCSDVPIQGTARTLSTETNAALQARLATSTFSNLMCDLENKNFSDKEIPTALNQAGLKLTQAGEMDQSLAFYACAAQKYYDEQSMYRLAEVYAYGTDAMKAQFPVEASKFTTNIKRDLKEAYYWVSVLLHTDVGSRSGFMADDASDFSYSVISLLDSLQQDPSLTDNDLISEERDAIAFVAQKYPQVQNDEMSVYNHSMRAMQQALEAAKKDPSRIQVQHDPGNASTYIVEPVVPTQ